MDGLNHLRIDEVFDADSNGELEDPAATGDAWRVQRVYVNGPGQLGQIAKVIVFTCASATTNTVASEAVYYYHYDILGNVSVISDPNGDEADQFEQDAFGNLVSGSWTTRIGGITEQITTKPYDAALGLYYFNARWYDSQVGAFVSYDKWDRLGLRYMYAGASPTYFVDITGQKATSGAFRVHRGCRQDACDCLLKVLPESGPPLTSVAVRSWWQSVRQMSVDAVYLHHGSIKIADTAVCWVSCNRSGPWRRYPYRIGCIDSSGPAADIVRTITGNDTRAGLYKPGYTPSKGWPDNPFTLWIDEQKSGIELKSPDYSMYYGEENDGHFYLDIDPHDYSRGY